MRLGVFGGTFDPPHIAHQLLAEQAREQLQLDTVLWVPAGDPWRKGERDVTPAADRVAMVERTVEGNQAFEVSRLEIEREGPTYSVETLAALRSERPDAEPFFLLGADALADLPNWREPQRLIELVTLGVAAREGPRPGDGALEALLPGLSRRVAWIELPRLDISATELRRRASEGRSLRYFVAPAVEAYIREQGLYSAP